MKEFIEKLIGRLEEEKSKGYYDSNSVIGEKNVWSKAISIVNQLAEEYNNGWIPCSERLPEEEQKVLAYINPNIAKHEIILAPYESWNNCWHDGSIIAWQPLPEPFKS